jgi:hypothetical protein
MAFTTSIIADSDELWPVGSLAKLTAIVGNYGPAAISLPMLPVVGSPGYPIEGSEDRALASASGGCGFKDWIRSSAGARGN